MTKISNKIHYVWFGGQKDQKTLKCIESWKCYMPDYEIIEWNETNSPFNHQYLSNALAIKNYSNASNFIRLWALNKFGGVYFDADFELIKKLDFLENIEAFISFESDEIVVNNAISGAVIGHQFIIDCFNVLISKFDGSENSNLSGPILATDILRTYGLNENVPQILRGVNIFPKEYFHPYPPYSFFMYSTIKNNTYGIHHFAKSWERDISARKNDKLISNYYNILAGRMSLKLYIKLIVNKFLIVFKLKK